MFYESFDKSWKGRWIVSHKDEFTGTRWQLMMNIVFKVGGKREKEHKLKQRDQQKLKPESIIHLLF